MDSLRQIDQSLDSLLSRPAPRAPNTFVYGYQSTQVQKTFLDIKRYFRNADYDQNAMTWMLFFPNPIEEDVLVDRNMVFHVASRRARPGQQIARFTEADRPPGRAMQFQCRMSCSQLQTNVFVVLHHWAQYDSDKPDADAAVALMADVGKGFDETLRSVTHNTRLKPEMFTIQACFMDWIEAIACSQTRNSAISSRAIQTGLDIDGIVTNMRAILEDEIQGIDVMIDNTINPISTARNNVLSPARIRALQDRAKRIVLTAANTVFETTAISLETLRTSAPDSLEAHLRLVWSSTQFVREDNLRAKAADHPAHFRLGDVVSWRTANKFYDPVHLKLFSDVRKGDMILIQTVEDRWIVAEFDRSQVDSCPQEYELAMFAENDIEAYRAARQDATRRKEYAIRSRTFSFSTGITTSNLGCIWILKRKGPVAENEPSALTRFFAELYRHSNGLHNAYYVTHLLRTLFLTWDGTQDIQGLVDQLVIGWVQNICTMTTTHSFILTGTGWTVRRIHFVPDAAEFLTGNAKPALQRFMDRFTDLNWNTFRGFISDALAFALGSTRIESTSITAVVDWKIRSSSTVSRVDSLKIAALRSAIGQTVDETAVYELNPQPIRLGAEIQPGDIVLIRQEGRFLVSVFRRFFFRIWGGSRNAQQPHWDTAGRLTNMLYTGYDPNATCSERFPAYEVLHTNTLQLIHGTGVATSDLRNVFYFPMLH